MFIKVGTADALNLRHNWKGTKSSTSCITQKQKQKPSNIMSETSEITRGELEEVMVKQASESAAYREALIADPKGTLKKQLAGTPLPENLEVEVLEETPNKVFIVLPHSVAEGDELADEDLEQVAGGKGNKDTVNCNAPAAAGGFASKNEISIM